MQPEGVRTRNGAWAPFGDISAGMVRPAGLCPSPPTTLCRKRSMAHFKLEGQGQRLRTRKARSSCALDRCGVLAPSRIKSARRRRRFRLAQGRGSRLPNRGRASRRPPGSRLVLGASGLSLAAPQRTRRGRNGTQTPSALPPNVLSSSISARREKASHSTWAARRKSVAAITWSLSRYAERRQRSNSSVRYASCPTEPPPTKPLTVELTLWSWGKFRGALQRASMLKRIRDSAMRRAVTSNQRPPIGEILHSRR